MACTCSSPRRCEKGDREKKGGAAGQTFPERMGAGVGRSGFGKIKWVAEREKEFQKEGKDEEKDWKKKKGDVDNRFYTVGHLGAGDAKSELIQRKRHWWGGIQSRRGNSVSCTNTLRLMADRGCRQPEKQLPGAF